MMDNDTSNINSILLSVKKFLGLHSEDEDFDMDIILHINSILSNLIQMGVGPQDGFTITGKTEEWTDFLGDDKLLEQTKSYVYLKVKLLFDPPASSIITESYNRLINEFEWRLYVQKGGY